MKHIQQLMAFVEHAHTFSEEEKELFLLILHQGEPFDPVFIDEFSTAVEREKQFLEQEINSVQKEAEKWEKEKKEAVKEALPKVQKFLQEYTDICEKEMNTFSLGLSELEKEYDQEIEKLMGSSESSEIDSIRSKLLQK